MLHIKDLSFSFKSQKILKNLSFSLDKGEIATLLGVSGSGKTTLFNLIAGLHKASEGSIIISGSASYMMQDDLLLPWKTVLDNVILCSELGKKKSSKQELRKEALNYLADVGLAGRESAFPHELSGGMRQRASLARSLMQKSTLLLLDEPFASLDHQLKTQMYRLLLDIRKKYGTTILFITHDINEAMTLADKVLFLKNGAIQQSLSLDDTNRHDPSMQQTLLQSIFE